MNTTPFRPLIPTQADLEAVWRHLMEPLGFDDSSLWVMVICDDDRPVPQLTEISECRGVPEPSMTRRLSDFLAVLWREVSRAERVAMLRTRPGSHGPDATDLAWARTCYEAARQAGVACEVVHLANDETLVPLPWDAVGRRSA